MIFNKSFILSSLLLLLWALCSLLLSATPAVAEPTEGARRNSAANPRCRISYGKRIPWDTDISLLGDASLRNGAISLTSPSPSNTTRFKAGVGRALYSHPIRFLEPTTGSLASFSTRFTFSIMPPPSTSQIFGDGLAFLITSDPRSLGSSKGYMGLFSSDSSSPPLAHAQEDGSNHQIDTIAVEFDTSLDASLRDINDNHIALDVGSIISLASADAGNAGVNLRGGIPMTAWVEYISSEKTLQVWISYSHLRPPNPLLVTNIDLSSFFHESMYVGFSASDGQGAETIHLVQRWSFHTFGFLSSTSPAPPSTATGGRCPACSYKGTHEIPPSRMRNLWVGLGLGISLSLLFLMIMIAVALARRRREEGRPRGDNDDNQQRVVPARISLDEIKTATKGFHCSKILGQGGSATVYEGILPSGSKVAVKRFGRVELFTNTFATELAAVLGCYRHGNLVPIRGWCCEKNELLLVYEYMPNGSLDKALHGSPLFAATTTLSAAPAMMTLPWDKRFRIILDVASAVAFLHEECEKKIIHRDIKTSSILLDANFNAKLGDFGLAELNEHNRTPQAAQPAGTMGYLAPEYVHSGVATDKSDIYSYGIVVLEAATGRRPVDKGTVLIDWVWGLGGRGKLVEAADPRLHGRFSREEMSRTLTTGLCCAHPDSKQRPTMRKAIRILKGAITLPALPPKKPAVRLLSHVPEPSEDSIDPSPKVSSEDTWLTPCTSLSFLPPAAGRSRRRHSVNGNLEIDEAFS